MSILNIKDFNKFFIKSKLKLMDNEAYILLSILDFVFSDCIMDLMSELDDEFDSNVGCPCYPRALLLGIILYCFKRKKRKISEIVVECKTNRFLRVFTRGIEPSASTFKRFLENSSPEIMRKVFLYTLVVLNDYDFLKFTKAFIDGTDALVRGSRYLLLIKK